MQIKGRDYLSNEDQRQGLTTMYLDQKQGLIRQYGSEAGTNYTGTLKK